MFDKHTTCQSINHSIKLKQKRKKRNPGEGVARLIVCWYSKYKWLNEGITLNSQFSSVLNSTASKLDGVGTVDNGPSTYYLHHFVRQKKVTLDTWHMPFDTWQMTHEIWHVTLGGKWTFSQNFSSPLLRFGIDSVVKILNKRIPYSVNELITKVFIEKARLHWSVKNCTAVCTKLYCTEHYGYALHNIYCTAYYCTALHKTVQHWTEQNYTTQQRFALHYTSPPPSLHLVSTRVIVRQQPGAVDKGLRQH